ncbi:MAG: thymidylate synthase [Candidatus Hydrogenedentes bacterium]|nr:thymidylate synthase [Candidatus Hydrogenedentota bacterium]
MSTDVPIVIEAANLSTAWGRAFLHVMSRSPRQLAPLIVSISEFNEGTPVETTRIREELDHTLKSHGKFACDVTAFTIFPHRLWAMNKFTDRDSFYKAYMTQVLPRLKARDSRNSHGTYFERMIAYQGSKKEGNGYVPKPKNQLEHIIQVWMRDRSKNRRTRRSALQIACWDPIKDLTGSALAGFPCLQQVSFSYDDEDGLAVNAYYPTQYIFDRAYGNYLGLCHLGKFMAHEMGLKLRRLTCYVGQPEIGSDITKHGLRNLAAVVKDCTLEPLPEVAAQSDVVRGQIS